MMSSKAEVAKRLADEQGEDDPGIERIIRIEVAGEDDPSEPIKLLAVSRDTPPSGIVPIFFGPTADVPYPLVVVEITPHEFEEIENHQRPLPTGWTLRDSLYFMTENAADAGP